MTTQRFQDLLDAEDRIFRCGCGGACEACRREPRPTDEAECEAFTRWLAEEEAR